MHHTYDKSNNSSTLNPYFYKVLISLKGVDPTEKQMLLIMHEFLDFNKDIIGQTFFHSIEDWSKDLEIGLSTVSRKIKSLQKKGYWIVEIPKKRDQHPGGLATIFRLTPKIFENFKPKSDRLTLIKINSHPIQNEEGTLFKMNTLPIQNEQGHPIQNEQPINVLKSIYNHVCVENQKSESPDGSDTHTQNLKIEEKKKKSAHKTKQDLIGKITDYIKMNTKQNFYSFSDSEKLVDKVYREGKFEDYKKLDDMFYDFKRCTNLGEFFDVNNFTIYGFENGLIRFCLKLNPPPIVSTPKQTFDYDAHMAALTLKMKEMGKI